MSLDETRIKGLCFDVDGTLADTDDQFVETLASWLSISEGLPSGVKKRLAGRYYSAHSKISATLARRIVMGMESPANMLYGIPDRLHLDQPMLVASEWLREVSTGWKAKETDAAFKIISGVAEMLKELSRHFPLSVVSARGERGTMRFLDQFNLAQYFTSVVTAHTCRYTKPYPDPVVYAARKMGLQPEECLMIGDTTVDIRAGRAAGAQTVGVLCGFGTADELQECGANEIVNSTTNVVSLLKIN